MSSSIYTINSGQWNSQAYNGPAQLSSIPSSQKVLYNQTGIVLDWTGVEDATHYQVQVSLFPDFRTTFVDQQVTVSNYSFTDSQTNNRKRYWRWRPLVLPGPIYFEHWSEVGSYWLNTGVATEIELAVDEWVFINPNDTDDTSWFELIPMHSIVRQNLYRFHGRNRAGELLSEYLVNKDRVSMIFNGAQYIDHRQLNEIRRYHVDLRTFYLACYKAGEWHRPMPHIWLSEFNEDPAFTMIAAGRGDLLTGSINTVEV